MNTDTIAARIRALLAKTVAAGATEAEAMSAAEKARELMEKYRIEAGDLDNDPIGTEDVATARGREISDFLRRGVGIFCGVKAWQGPGNRPVFTGRRGDIAFAAWLLEALEMFVARRAVAYMADLPSMSPRAREDAMRAFSLACASRISQRLVADAPRDDRRKEDARGIARYLAENGIVLTPAKSSTTRLRNGAAAAAGRAAGEGAQFNRPVNAGGPVLKIAC